MDAMFDLIERMMARREHVFKGAPSCPRCAADQVQCTEHLTSPAQWKCRDCRYEWDYEPPGWTGHER